ncbi:hypothetical protein [Flavihumibacter sp. UBA7668]|uniref:hypothetical protein n=1 Tax=Flavihumibacter sp. UBA7668 TaxID=1946542 RepID=UPI0025C0B078|nr:hypothetical protein [Flavihumibacter sp. UBA7668]
MDNPELKPTTKDYVIKLTKGALGAVPFVGGLLGELLDIAVVPQQQKKLNEWFDYVEKTLNELVEIGGKTKEEIFNDEQFLSIFQKTSRIYSSNVEEHKKPILKAYLKASATKQIPLDKKYIFLNIIDQLTETQLLILRDVYDNEKSADYLYKNQLEQILVGKYANGDKQYLDLLIKGLQDFHLLGYGSADVVIDGVNQWHMQSSKIAKDLLSYLLDDEN